LSCRQRLQKSMLLPFGSQKIARRIAFQMQLRSTEVHEFLQHIFEAKHKLFLCKYDAIHKF